MQLFPAIVGSKGNRYCGPAALVSTLGVDIDDATAAIRRRTGKPNVFGVHPLDLHHAATTLGGNLVRIDVPRPAGRKTTSGEQLAQLLGPGIYIVWTPRHYYALDVSRAEVCDNHTKYPLDIARYRFRRNHVAGVFRVVGRP